VSVATRDATRRFSADFWRDSLAQTADDIPTPGTPPRPVAERRSIRYVRAALVTARAAIVPILLSTLFVSSLLQFVADQTCQLVVRWHKEIRSTEPGR
jgi:hypothetical protein